MIEESKMISECPRHEIAAYIDGELSPSEELALDLHMAGCGVCMTELNDQKLFLNGLERSLKDERGLELPPDFAKVVVVNAESNVRGIRRRSEFRNALIITIGLLALILFAIGANANGLMYATGTIFEQLATVGSFFGYLIYTFLVGISIILRSFASQFRLDLVLTTAVVFVSFGLLMLASRKWVRFHRA